MSERGTKMSSCPALLFPSSAAPTSSPCCSARSTRPASDRATAVVVGGDAGVGKTRLLSELNDIALEPRPADDHRPLRRPRRRAAAVPSVQRGLRPARGRRPRGHGALTAAHPAIERLLPGRVAPRRRRPHRPWRTVRVRPRRARPTLPPSGPSCCSSRTSTGPTRRPATCSASSSPGCAPSASR